MDDRSSNGHPAPETDPTPRGRPGVPGGLGELSQLAHLGGAPRRGLDRDRRGRGMRGPAFGPGGPHGRVPAQLTRREQFDRLALDVLDDVASRWTQELAALELAVEDIPVLPGTWVAPRVPLASLVPATGTTPARLVLYRRPLEHRADTGPDLEALVLTVVVEQLADLLGVPPEEVHPDYEE